jgi:hypothetical protein
MFQGVSRSLVLLGTLSIVACKGAISRQTGIPVYETHILFTGIASIHHERNKPVDEVVIPIVHNHSPAPATGEGIPNHTSFIVVDLGVLDVIAGPSEYSEHTSGAKLRLYVLPIGTKLHVDGLTGSGASTTDTPEASCQQTEGNFYYVPRLANLLLPEACMPSAIGVAATYRISAGEFFAWVLNGYYQDFRGIGGKSHHKQRVAQVADWKFTRPSGHLVLKDQNDVVVLEVKPQDPSVPIAVVTGSAELKDLGRVLDQKAGMPHDHDHHFDVYYDRCNNPADRPIPFNDTKCDADNPYQKYPWWPIWMRPDWIHRVAGGFNCGPDQFP